MLRVLVVDDEKNIRTTLRICLEEMTCRVTEADGAAKALSLVENQVFDLVFLDLRLGKDDGLGLLPRLRDSQPGAQVIVITAYATIETAVEAMKLGASDFLPKPFKPGQVDALVERVEERRRLLAELDDLRSKVDRDVLPLDLVSSSPAMQSSLDSLDRAASHEVAVLIRGENGTGKTALARILHSRSPRREGPFVVVNCPALTPDLLASELFGHRQGAFTGAVGDQMGKVEAADGGTLFLDEVGELDPSLQAKMLRFLEEKSFERIGETRTRKADVRVVAATNRDLEADVAAGRFRQDMYFRLNALEITVPPLRERVEDIPRLARLFLAFISRSQGKAPFELSETALQKLCAYSWPGNVRELRNAIERAVIFAHSDVLDLPDLPERIRGSAPLSPRVGGDHTLEDIEREHIQRVQARCPTQEEAARILGLDVSTLWRKRKKWDSLP